MIFLIVAPPTEPTLAAGCANNQECPDHAACRNRLCINPCAYDNPCAPNANCRVVNHEPVCTCPDGYIGSPETSCELRKHLRKLYIFTIRTRNISERFIK